MPFFSIRMLFNHCDGHWFKSSLLVGLFLMPVSPGYGQSPLSVVAGKSITLTSSSPVTWSLCSGCIGRLSTTGPSTSTIYTAPNGIVAPQVWLGCPVGPGDDVFHTRVDGLPVHQNSLAWLANSSPLGIRFDPAWGVTYADKNTPRQQLKEFYGESNITVPKVNGISLKREGGNNVGINGYVSAPDHHVVIVDRTSCTFSEYYDDRLNGVTVTCQDGVTTGCNVQSGISYNSNNYSAPLGANRPTDAAGLELAPLTLTLSDLKSGHIRHALRFTTSLGYIYGNPNLGQPFLWPATQSNGCTTCVNAPPMGARARISSSTVLASLIRATCTSELTYCAMILTDLYEYGGVLSDIGFDNDIQYGLDVSSDPEATVALQEIFDSGVAFNSNNFAFVDESSLFFEAGSYQVTPFQSQSFAGQYGGFQYQAQTQSFVVPANQAVVTGGDTHTSIAVQPVTIGTKYGPDVVVMAGAYQWPIPAWVTPTTASQEISWTKVDGTCVGDSVSNGIYVPSVTLEGATSCTTVLEGVAADDNAATSNLYLTLIPAGTVGLDYGGFANSIVDNVPWISTVNSEGGAYFDHYADTYPQWSQSGDLQSIFSTGYYSSNDQTQQVIVPNGNYDISFLVGINGTCGTQTNCLGWGGLGPWSYGPYQLETQSNVVEHFFDVGSIIGYQPHLAAPIQTVPARVTDNTLSIGLRMLSNDIDPTYAAVCPRPYCSNIAMSNSAKYAVLSGIQVARDTKDPHWTIDTQGQTSIEPGQTLMPFLVVDWFTGVNDPRWSIVSGPTGATISPGGVLSLDASSVAGGQAITLAASDGLYSATATIKTAKSTSSPPPPAGYNYMRAISIHPDPRSNTDQVGFPVELLISDPTLAAVSRGGHVISPNGYDIVLASDSQGQNLLKWEVESYDSTAGAWLAHVQVPLLSHTADTVIYLLYGSANIQTSLASSSAVWDVSYVGVYHFASASNILADSTAIANTGTPADMGYSTQGQVGGSAVLTGGFGTFPINLGQKGTIEMWVNSAAGQNGTNNGFLFAQGWYDPDNQFAIGWSSYARDFHVLWCGQSQSTMLSVPVAQMSIEANTWHHIAYTWDWANSTQSLYRDGALIISSSDVPATPAFSSALSVGVPINPAYYGFAGLIDEVRISNTARSQDWIHTQYLNQLSPSTFLTVGTEASESHQQSQR